MTDALAAPLLVRVTEYITEGNHDATPDEVLRECALDESRRAQVEHFCAVTRYSLYNDCEANDTNGLGVPTDEWTDVLE